MICPLFCNDIKKIKEKYLLGINIPMKLVEFQIFYQICMVVKVKLLPWQPF